MVTLEGLSFGKPVLISSTVGAKDIINQIDPWFIFKDEDELFDKLYKILTDPSVLSAYRTKIMLKEFDFTMDSHIKKIDQVYMKVCYRQIESDL